jgi:hypothetical protein
MKKIFVLILFLFSLTTFGQYRSVKVAISGDSLVFLRNGVPISKIGGLTTILQNMGGIPGPQGPVGPKGDRGDTGLQGERGLQGVDGSQGPQGLQGVPGSTGTPGYTPIKGVDYFDGVQGPSGTPGAKGDTGDQGPQGNPGNQGIQGIQGPAGSDATVTKSAVEAVLTGEISTHTHASGGGNIAEYTIMVQALTSSPADGGTVYFGMLPKTVTTSANISKVHVRKAGTIKIANIYCYSGTAGTGEAWSLYIRKNNTTDYLIQTLSVAASERVFTNSSLSIPMVAGDYFEIKSVYPTFATNPLTTIYSGYVLFE